MSHNTFTLRCGDTTVAACNRVLIPAAAALANGKRYAKFLRIHTESGVYCYETETVCINSDPANGALCACYGVVLDKSDLAGETICALSLSPDGVTDVNFAELTAPFLKSGAEELSVTADVYLDAEFAHAVVAVTESGGNPLIRGLLGAEDFDPASVTVRWGECAVSERLGVTDTVERTEHTVAVTAVADSGALTLSFELPPSARDAVVCVKGEPSLRVSLDPLLSAGLVYQRTVGASRR